MLRYMLESVKGEKSENPKGKGEMEKGAIKNIKIRQCNILGRKQFNSLLGT